MIKLSRFPKVIEELYRLLKNTARSKKFTNPSFSEYINKVNALKNISWVLFAYLPGSTIPVSGIWMAKYSDVTYYIHAGSSPEGYTVCANHYLVAEAITLSQLLGAYIFDFEGVFDPRFPKTNPIWRGFSEFKRRFGGDIKFRLRPRIRYFNNLVQAVDKITKFV